MFCVSPCTAKNKFDIAVSLTILHLAREDTQKWPSRADDADTNPLRRQATHFLQRTLNKMHAYMELSEYQVAADLLNLPSHLTSEVHGYTDPDAGLACDAHYENSKRRDAEDDRAFQAQNATSDKEERQLGLCDDLDDFLVDDPDDETESEDELPHAKDDNEAMDQSTFTPTELTGDLGRICVHTVEKASNSNQGPTKVHMPVAFNYRNRGEALKKLSRYEYDALVIIKCIKTNKQLSNARSKQFSFPPSYELAASHAQFLRAKHRTMIFHGRSPDYPGKPPRVPSTSQRMKSWKKKADRFARYYLAAFRPEEDAFVAGQRTNLGYKWDDLLQWVDKLQKDGCLISKMRLIAFNYRVHCLRTSHSNKKLGCDYRARERDLWPEGVQSEASWIDRMCQQIDASFLSSSEYEEKHNSLSAQITNNLLNILMDDKDQVRNLNKIYVDADRPSIRRNLRHMRVPRKRASIPRSQTHGLASAHEVLSRGEDLHKLDKDDGDASRKLAPQVGKESCCNDKIDRVALAVETISARLNKEQKRLFDVYNAYLKDTSSSERLPPPLVLLTGTAGTGKSEIVRSIDTVATFMGHRILKLAFNNTNAIDIGGPTLASFCSLNKKHFKEFRTLSADQRQKLRNVHNVDEVKLIIVDEISNVPSHCLARLSDIFKQIKDEPDLPFGGVPVLLVGDFGQKGPVRVGGSLLNYLMKVVKRDVDLGIVAARMTHQKKVPVTVEDVERMDADLEEENKPEDPFQAGRASRIRKPKNDLQTTSSLKRGSPVRVGCELLRHARWYELTKQERSKDAMHTKLVCDMHNGRPVDMSMLRRYKQIDLSNILHEHDKNGHAIPWHKNPWHRAPIIVKTNRERLTLNAERCRHFAKLNSTVVVRWRLTPEIWEQKPSDLLHQDLCLRDNAFFEYFVAGIDGYVTDNVTKQGRIINGSRVRYHSLTLDPEEERTHQTKCANATPGQVITLDTPPLSINVVLVDEEEGKRVAVWKNITLVQGRAVVPLIARRTTRRSDKSYIAIPGGLLFHPSRICIQNLFPVEPAFAMTVDKAQGRTLQKVIVALSSKKGKKCQLDYASICVALSRVHDSNDIRFLVMGDTEHSRLESLRYITTLTPDKCVKSYFHGFSGQLTKSWDRRSWDWKKSHSVCFKS